MDLSILTPPRTPNLRGDLPAAHGFPVLEDLLDAAPVVPPADLPAPDDVASYFHTGGTTRTPKLAAHTHRNQAVNAWMMNACADDSDTRGMGILAGRPWFHVNAWMVTGLATFGILNVNAPNYGGPSAGAGDNQQDKPLLLTVAIAKDGFYVAATGGVLMLAFMNQEA